MHTCCQFAVRKQTHVVTALSVGWMCEAFGDPANCHQERSLSRDLTRVRIVHKDLFVRCDSHGWHVARPAHMSKDVPNFLFLAGSMTLEWIRAYKYRLTSQYVTHNDFRDPETGLALPAVLHANGRCFFWHNNERVPDNSSTLHLEKFQRRKNSPFYV